MTKTAAERGTDAQIDAGTHCPVDRSPYRLLDPRPETFNLGVKECTGDDCDHWTYDRDTDKTAEAVAEAHAAVAEATVHDRRDNPSWPAEWAEALGTCDDRPTCNGDFVQPATNGFNECWQHRGVDDFDA